MSDLVDEKIRLVESKTTSAFIKKVAAERFGDMVKAVVDLEKGVMAIGGELHADEEAFLIEKGSRQDNLWGINFYPESPKEQMIEFDSMINIRPGQGNRSRRVESEETRKKIIEIVNKLVE